MGEYLNRFYNQINQKIAQKAMFKLSSMSIDEKKREQSNSHEDALSVDPMEDTSLQAALSLFMSTQGVREF